MGGIYFTIICKNKMLHKLQFFSDHLMTHDCKIDQQRYKN